MADAKRTCSFDGCDRTHYGNGHCKAHYDQLRRGRPLAPVQERNSPAPPFERVMRRTAREGNCLKWTGSVDRDGYGELRVGRKLERTHRIVWEHANGPIPDGMVIDHKCRNRLCVDLSHLQVVTRKLNGENRSAASTANPSGLRGVFYRKRDAAWIAQVKHAGRFYTEQASSRDDAHQKVVALRNRLHSNNLADR